jgi:hypothetical protein
MSLSGQWGGNQVFKVTDSGSTLRDISDWITDFKLPEDVGMADLTTLGHTAKVVLPTIEDAKLSASGKWDSTINGYIVGIKRSLKACEYYPMGTTTGNPKATFNAMVTNFERGGNENGEMVFSLAMQISNGITWGVAP